MNHQTRLIAGFLMPVAATILREKMETRMDASSAVSAGGTKIGATAAVYGGFTANEIAAFGGLAVALIGLAYNIWHGQRRLAIMERRIENNEADL